MSECDFCEGANGKDVNRKTGKDSVLVQIKPDGKAGSGAQNLSTFFPSKA